MSILFPSSKDLFATIGIYALLVIAIVAIVLLLVRFVHRKRSPSPKNPNKISGEVRDLE